MASKTTPPNNEPTLGQLMEMLEDRLREVTRGRVVGGMSEVEAGLIATVVAKLEPVAGPSIRGSVTRHISEAIEAITRDACKLALSQATKATIDRITAEEAV